MIGIYMMYGRPRIAPHFGFGGWEERSMSMRGVSVWQEYLSCGLDRLRLVVFQSYCIISYIYGLSICPGVLSVCLK